MRTASLAILSILLLGTPAVPAARAATRALVVTTDYGVSGSAADVGLNSPWTLHDNVATTGSDAVVRWHGGRFHVVNRAGGDNIQVLDPVPSWHIVVQFSVGAGSNPHDIAFVSTTKAYVTRYDSPELWVVNPQTGAHTGTVSFAAFADADGIPEMDQAAVVGKRLFVSLQLLDRANFYAPTGPGKVVVIDTDADTVLDANPALPGKQAIPLTGANPNTPLLLNRADGRLYVGETGDYGVLDGGIEGIDPVGLTAGGFAVREDSLHADINLFRFTSGTEGYAIVSDASFNTALVRFDLSTHRRTATIYAPGGFVLVDVNVDDAGQVWVADRSSSAPGVRVFDAASGVQKTSTPVSTGLKPGGIAFDLGTPTAVPGPGRPGARPLTVRALGGAVSAGGVEFSVRGGLGARRARIVDVSGRVLRAWGLPAGPTETTLIWDGAASGGGWAASGVYWLRVECGQEAGVAKVVRVK
ncbi:MAG: hypothetical protein HZB25_07170 [Candidatus Eisenbacteria bacterium]|nr:hypothetical protein [Candidatus Eisenbacteria bacterium]